MAPLFGGITATAAIARTATSVRFGAVSPVAGMVHALVVLMAIMVLAGALSQLPMAALAALLLVVAWNMSEAGHFVRIVRTAPRGDVAVLLTCFGLTVIFDMVIAVAVGMALAAMLFIQRMAGLTSTEQLRGSQAGLPRDIPGHMAVFRIRGPMFFGAAERALSTLHRLEPGVNTVIVDMREVPSMDMSAIVVFQSMVDHLRKGGVALIVTHAEPRIIAKLRRAGIRRIRGQFTFCRNSEQALRIARDWQQVRSGTSQEASEESGCR